MSRMNRQHKLSKPHRQYNFLIAEDEYQKLMLEAERRITTPAALVRQAVTNFLKESDGTGDHSS